MSAGIAVEALTVTLGAFRLKNLDLAVSPGEILVILGPNGSGKSVTLETIAGFHRPDSGRISIGGRDVTAWPPERRKVGFLVQSFGLFPHLSVAQNVAIARRGDRAVAVHDAAFPVRGGPEVLLAYFGVGHLARRGPADLSPGEKQRVALARAIAGAPDLFLFDEPFSALDALTRDQLRDDLLSFLRDLAIPAILVTHDHIDARAFADKIVVLRDGAMVQSGAAAEIFQKPASSSVARFVGVENVFPGRIIEIADGLARLAVGERTLRAAVPARPVATGSSVFLGIRAEDVTIRCPLGAPPPQGEINRLAGRVTGLRSAPPLATVTIDCGFPLKAYLLEPHAREMKLSLGGAVAVQIAQEAIHIMPE